MWHKRILISVLSILWSICLGEVALFDVGLISYVNKLGDRGPGHVYFFYPSASDDKYHSTTDVDLEYLFNEVSTTGYDLQVKAVSNSPVIQGKYPIVAYLHGEGGFALDTHRILTHISSMGFVVVTADMPGYRVGDPVLASAVQSSMGEVLTTISHSCPSEALEICDAMDFKNIVALGPGVVDATCTLNSWTKLGLHPSAQLVLDGEIEVDLDCHPVEFDTQDVSLLAFGKKGLDSMFNEKVEMLRGWTEEDTKMSAYLLGFSEVPSLAAFTDLCEISHKIRPVRHLAGTKICSEIDQDDLNDAQTMTRAIISNILLHHYRNSPMTLPGDNFHPKDYPYYVYRAIGEGLIKDFVGKLDGDSSEVHILPAPSDSAYSFRNTTALAVLPLIMVGVLYFTCGIGLCMSDCRNVKGICFDGLISQSFREVFSRRHSTQLSRNSNSQMADYLRRMRSRSATPDTQVEHSTSSPRTVITYSTYDFLTGDKRSPTPRKTPRSECTNSRTHSIELISLDPGNVNSQTEPLIPSCGPRIPKTVKKIKEGLPKSEPKIKNQKREQKISYQELYEALGSGPDSDGEETKPITNSELKLLKV